MIIYRNLLKYSERMDHGKGTLRSYFSLSSSLPLCACGCVCMCVWVTHSLILSLIHACVRAHVLSLSFLVFLSLSCARAHALSLALSMFLSLFSISSFPPSPSVSLLQMHSLFRSLSPFFLSLPLSLSRWMHFCTFVCLCVYIMHTHKYTHIHL